MANSNPNLLATQTIFSLFLLTFLLSINNVNSESFSVSFPKFDNVTDTIVLGGDAKNIGGVLQLTKKDQLGKPSPHSFGLSAFSKPILLSDKKSGKVAHFNTEFTFVVDPKGAELHGDGFTFFILSVGADLPVDESSEGGFLGLFNKETAFNTSKNSIVAVEFDTYTDEWDPNSPHIGIDINTIESSVAAPWPIDRLPQGSIGKAQISYESVSKELRVVVSYPNSPVTVEVLLSYPVDFAAILSDWVLFGFSAATGELAETHDILSWSFSTNI